MLSLKRDGETQEMKAKSFVLINGIINKQNNFCENGGCLINLPAPFGLFPVQASL